jgi:hypothetical protein
MAACHSVSMAAGNNWLVRRILATLDNFKGTTFTEL